MNKGFLTGEITLDGVNIETHLMLVLLVIGLELLNQSKTWLKCRKLSFFGP